MQDCLGYLISIKASPNIQFGSFSTHRQGHNLGTFLWNSRIEAISVIDTTFLQRHKLVIRLIATFYKRPLMVAQEPQATVLTYFSMSHAM